MTVVTNTIPSSVPEDQSEAHKAHLLAVADGTAKPGDAPGTPGDNLILGKFKTQDDLLKAYTELEKKLGAAPAPKTDGEPPKTDGEPPKTDGDPPKLTVEDDAAKKAVEGAGLDFAKYNDAWLSEGQLSDDHYKELEGKGFSREIVDVYTDGLKARQERALTSAFDIVGGADNYRSMGQWAAANLQQSERDAFNKAVSTGTAESRELAIRGLFAKFSAAAGEPDLTSGNGGGPTISGFRSWSEVKVAMGDKRYGKDPAYTADIQNKMKVSKF